MAHEIDQTNGIDHAAFRMTPAWHGLGKVITDRKCTSDVMEEAAGLGWNVSKRDIFFRDDNGNMVKLQDHVVTVRDDYTTPLGVVGKDYATVQNRQAFDFLDSFIQDGVIEYESAMSLRGGRIVVLTMRLPSVDEIAPGDNTNRYIMFQTSHDGTMRLNAIPTATRVVCANTLRLALASNSTNLEGLRHSGDMVRKLDRMKILLSQYDEAFDLYRDKGRKLAAARIETPAHTIRYIESLFPVVKDEGRGRTIRDNKYQAVMNAMSNPRQTLPGIEGTWWAAFNAVTETVDHSDVITFKGDGRERAENKYLNVIDGIGANFKQRAFDLACEAAGV